MINDIFQKQKHLYIVFFLFFSQFFILNAYYFDDLFRSQNGYFGWTGDGRALGGLLYKVLLNFQSPLADIYPIPIIITGFIFCFVIYHLCQALTIDCRKQQILILLLTISSPLALSNWLFRYDSAFMLLSVAFALIPFCLLNLPTKKWFLYSLLALLSLLMTYQISVNIFIGFTAIFAFKLVSEHSTFKSICYFILKCTILLIVAYLIYAKIILQILSVSWLGSKYQQYPQLQTIFSTIYHNIISTWYMLNNLFKSNLIYPILISVIFNLHAIDKSNTQSKIRMMSYYLIALFTVLFSISGIMLVSETAPFIARTFLGIIPFLIFPSLVLIILKFYKLFFISAIYLCLTMLVIDRATINSVNAEIQHQNTITRQIMAEVSMNNITDIEYTLIIGQPSKSGIALNNEQTFPIIPSVLPHTFSGLYDAGRYVMIFNGFPRTETPDATTQEGLLKQLPSTKPIASNPLYALYYINKTLIINFDFKR